MGHGCRPPRFRPFRLHVLPRQGHSLTASGNTVKYYFVKYDYLAKGADLRRDQVAESQETKTQDAASACDKRRARADVVVADADQLEAQLSVIQQTMSAARARNAAMSGKIGLRMEVEIGP